MSTWWYDVDTPRLALALRPVRTLPRSDSSISLPKVKFRKWLSKPFLGFLDRLVTSLFRLRRRRMQKEMRAAAANIPTIPPTPIVALNPVESPSLESEDDVTLDVVPVAALRALVEVTKSPSLFVAVTTSMDAVHVAADPDDTDVTDH